ncbi:MAG: hypothetical protein JJT89_05015 [Nitriliruptoraceae bacterium]|nr:hypothetical protein [Nitriliruptoraceae bacterium]
MSGASAQVRAAGQQAASVSRWLDQCGTRHDETGRATRSTLSELGGRWRSPHAEIAVARGGEVAERLARAVDPLRTSARTMARLEEEGAQVSRLLQSLEQREVELRRALSTLTAPVDDPLAAAEVAARRRVLSDQIREVQRRIQAALEGWRASQSAAAAQLEQAATWVRGQVPTIDVQGLVERFDRWARHLRVLVDGVADGVNRVVDGLQAWVVVTRRTVAARVREVRRAVRGRVVQIWRQVQVTTTTTYLFFRRQAPQWLLRLRSALGVVRPIVRVGARVLGGVGAALSGYDRFQRDANRPDTTSTERWLRAGAEAGIRSVIMAPAVALSKAMITGSIAATAGSFGLGAFLIPLAIGGSGLLLYGADKGGAFIADKLLDEVEWFHQRVRRLADRIDDTGRAIRDGYRVAADGIETAVDWTVERAEATRDRIVDGVETTRDWTVERAEATRDHIVDGAEATRDRIVDGVETARDWTVDQGARARDGIDALGSSVAERVSDVSWRDLVPTPRPVSLPLLGGGRGW